MTTIHCEDCYRDLDEEEYYYHLEPWSSEKCCFKGYAMVNLETSELGLTSFGLNARHGWKPVYESCYQRKLVRLGGIHRCCQSRERIDANKTDLYYACRDGHYGCYKSLMEFYLPFFSSGDPKQTESFLRTCLRYAIIGGCREFIDDLIGKIKMTKK